MYHSLIFAPRVVVTSNTRGSTSHSRLHVLTLPSIRKRSRRRGTSWGWTPRESHESALSATSTACATFHAVTPSPPFTSSSRAFLAASCARSSTACWLPSGGGCCGSSWEPGGAGLSAAAGLVGRWLALPVGACW